MLRSPATKCLTPCVLTAYRNSSSGDCSAAQIAGDLATGWQQLRSIGTPVEVENPTRGEFGQLMVRSAREELLPQICHSP
jgi:hypothetical protein